MWDQAKLIQRIQYLTIYIFCAWPKKILGFMVCSMYWIESLKSDHSNLAQGQSHKERNRKMFFWEMCHYLFYKKD